MKKLFCFVVLLHVVLQEDGAQVHQKIVCVMVVSIMNGKKVLLPFLNPNLVWVEDYELYIIINDNDDQYKNHLK